MTTFTRDSRGLRHKRACSSGVALNVTFESALAARIAAALAFALTAAFAAIAAPSWALVLIAVASVGVCLAHSAQTPSGQPGRGLLGLAGGIGVICAGFLAGGLAIGLALLAVWRAMAETLATESMLRDIARRATPARLDRGRARALHLAAAPAVALALLFSVHGGKVFGQSAFVLPIEAAIVIGAVGVVALLDWLIRRLADWRLGAASKALTLHVGAHHALFLIIGTFASDGAALIAGLIAWRILRHAPALPGLAVAAAGPGRARRDATSAAQAGVFAR